MYTDPNRCFNVNGVASKCEEKAITQCINREGVVLAILETCLKETKECGGRNVSLT